MSYYKAQTEIVGDVTQMRCYPCKEHRVANLDVQVRFGNHVEIYRVVAFNELGTETENTVAAGDVVSASGYMKTSYWNGQARVQLIASEVTLMDRAALADDQPAEKPQRRSTEASPRQPKQRRQYGRHARKSKQENVVDFRHVANGEPEFNDDISAI